MPKTESVNTTELSKALEQNGMKYEVTDITKRTYELLKKKRKAAIAHQSEFEAEGCKQWFDMLVYQTEYAMKPYEEFAHSMARYIYVIRK